MPCEVQKGQLGSAKRQGEREGTHHPGEGAKQRDSLRCREGQLWFASASSTKRTTTDGRKVAEHDVAARADGQIAAWRFGKVDEGGVSLGALSRWLTQYRARAGHEGRGEGRTRCSRWPSRTPWRSRACRSG